MIPRVFARCRIFCTTNHSTQPNMQTTQEMMAQLKDGLFRKCYYSTLLSLLQITSSQHTVLYTIFSIYFGNKHQHTFTDKFQICANVVKRSEIELVEVRRILDGNYVFPSKRLISNEVFPEVWLDVQLLNGLTMPDNRMTQ